MDRVLSVVLLPAYFLQEHFAVVEQTLLPKEQSFRVLPPLPEPDGLCRVPESAFFHGSSDTLGAAYRQAHPTRYAHIFCNNSDL